MRNKGLTVGIVSILIVLFVTSCTNNRSINDTNSNTAVETIQTDNIDLNEAIIIGDGRSENSFDTINESNSELAKTTLSSLGLDVADVDKFAIKIDPRLDSAYTVGIFKTTDVDKVKNKLLEYIIAKQTALEGTDETLYNIACNAVVANEKDYVLIGMREDADIFIDKMRNFVKVKIRENNKNIRKPDDTLKIFDKHITEGMRKITDKAIANIEKERTYKSAMAALD